MKIALGRTAEAGSRRTRDQSGIFTGQDRPGSKSNAATAGVSSSLGRPPQREGRASRTVFESYMQILCLTLSDYRIP
jgi:hypothetical protein